jgi:predicted NodU family carbamoyl transferase
VEHGLSAQLSSAQLGSAGLVSTRAGCYIPRDARSTARSSADAGRASVTPVFYEKPMLKFARILTTVLRAFPRSRRAFVQAMRNSLGEKVWVKGIITAELGVARDKVLFTQHHQAHAAAAFFPMPTQRAAILTTDGVGEWATLTIGRGARAPGGRSSLELLREVRFPHSLGLFYSAFTTFLGFPVNAGEYKVMGLASYGKPRFTEEVRRTIVRTPDGAFRLALEYFDFQESARRSFGQRFIDLFGPPRDPDQVIDLATAEGARHADVAASAQAVLEEVLVDLARGLRRGMPDARSARPSTPTGSISGSPTARSPIIRSGVPWRTRPSWPGSRPKTGFLSPRRPATGLSLKRSRPRSPPAR